MSWVCARCYITRVPPPRLAVRSARFSVDGDGGVGFFSCRNSTFRLFCVACGPACDSACDSARSHDSDRNKQATHGVVALWVLQTTTARRGRIYREAPSCAALWRASCCISAAFADLRCFTSLTGRLRCLWWCLAMWDVHLDEPRRLACFNRAKRHVAFDPPRNYRRNYSDL